MLVLTRKRGEKVIVTCPDGTELAVTVVEVGGGKVRLGFDAPAAYRIRRLELFDAPGERKD